MKLPDKLGPIHFIGIGGIGMSGIAEVMHNLGYTVQGSDASDNANVRRLSEKGIRTFVGHRAENLAEAALVVVSTAIRRDNPELVSARERRLPVVRRAEMLAELMRFKSCVAVAGTHGKTTTTSLVATLLDAGSLDPTVINGGIINAYGTNARMGEGDWMVVEADESDGTFLKLPADIAIVTNIDPEHLDHFGSFDAIKDAFRAFIDNIPFYGFAVMCIDHPTVQDLVGRIEDRRIVTYGENPQADVRLIDVDLKGGQSRFRVMIRDRRPGFRLEMEDLVLPMPGKHNALNATAALAVAHELGVSPEAIRKALANFGGVKRRFTRTGEWNGVQIFDDYGHHPVEIRAVLKAARASTDGGVIAVVQPHRYSRLASLFDDFCTCFNDADTVIVAPVYAAGEAPIEGIDRDTLVAGLTSRGHRNAIALERTEDLAGIVGGLARPATTWCAWAPATSPNGPMRSGRARLGRREGGVSRRPQGASGRDPRYGPSARASPVELDVADALAALDALRCSSGTPSRRARSAALKPRLPRQKREGGRRGAQGIEVVRARSFLAGLQRAREAARLLASRPPRRGRAAARTPPPAGSRDRARRRASWCGRWSCPGPIVDRAARPDILHNDPLASLVKRARQSPTRSR